ncbi:hypothetical protein JYU34_012462 [Plutella xylostella]|uniref:Uncharacterized protein n=1 Tax=Plutella xylostella TaxID=51655 RepID=A0ABQ7QF25_PLUXY|nr:hypothetical protein JYU34_012462 [Plutella xylostella]
MSVSKKPKSSTFMEMLQPQNRSHPRSPEEERPFAARVPVSAWSQVEAAFCDARGAGVKTDPRATLEPRLLPTDAPRGRHLSHSFGSFCSSNGRCTRLVLTSPVDHEMMSHMFSLCL